MGDAANNLGYRFYPNALCLEVGCDFHVALGMTERISYGPLFSPKNLRVACMNFSAASFRAQHPPLSAGFSKFFHSVHALASR